MQRKERDRVKTRLRNLLWVFMALTLLLAGTTLVRAYDISFSDVPESSWFYEDVMTLSESGVVSGYPDGTYRPTKKVTTGESLKMILLAAGYPEPERAESHWARGYLNFAIDQGFLVRYQDITDLDVNMTRGLLAKLAANALGLSDPAPTAHLPTPTVSMSKRSTPLGLSAATRTGRIARMRLYRVRRLLRLSTAFIRVLNQ